MKTRPVLMRMEMLYVVDVGEDADPNLIEFMRNEGSFCLDNDRRDILRSWKEWGCLCGPADSFYVREATPEDLRLYRGIE